MSEADAKELYLNFHGRVLEHLGIQIYQSTVSALAELIANAWDADATEVRIVLPPKLSSTAEITVSDTGSGMTFGQCQDRFLNVGWPRRGKDPGAKSPGKNRPVLGRKGIGKFAGFGIAEVIKVETISEETGERTVFQLDIHTLMGEEYIGKDSKPIEVLSYEPPEETRKKYHGTKITLLRLTTKRIPSEQAFRNSMARRFLIHKMAADFRILVNEQPLPDSFDLMGVQYCFPKDYKPDEKPDDLKEIDTEGWGLEEIAPGRTIRWRFFFHIKTIDEEELRGIAIFTRGKWAQKPFLFNLTGGLGGQHGVEYLSGQVQADYLDSLHEDLIATERQRINWDHDESQQLLDWGRERVKKLLRIWRERRSEKREQQIASKLVGFASRLDKLPASEAKTVKKALRKLASIETLDDQEFEDLGEAVLTTWEQGRLRELIVNISEAETMSEGEFMKLLLEAKVLTALNVAEAVKTKLATVQGLRARIENRELENAVRDFIAKNPWLISGKWETFKKETAIDKLAKAAAESAEFKEDDWQGRVDLVLSSGEHLLVLEFMRPGLKINWDHLSRFEKYALTLRTNIDANTAGRFKYVTGYIVADKLGQDAVTLKKIESLGRENMHALDWNTLFENAIVEWRELMDILVSRAPQDERLKSLDDVKASKS
jgi:hypothetical protein